jgi:hypothetical protein
MEGSSDRQANHNKGDLNHILTVQARALGHRRIVARVGHGESSALDAEVDSAS